MAHTSSGLDVPDPVRSAVRLSPLPALAIRTADDVVVDANESFAALAGAPASECIGLPLARWIPRLSWASLRTGPADLTVDTVAEGSQTVRVFAGPVVADCRLIALVPFPVDDARERRFHLAVEASPSGMLMTDGDGRIVLVNGETERLLGWTRAELLGRPVEMLLPERFRHGHASMREMFLASPAKRPMGHGRELWALRKDGSEIAVEIALTPIETPEGLLVLSSIVDVTARHEAARALLESEERFRLLVHGVHDYALVLLDARGLVMSWNAGAERIQGYTAEEIVGQPWDLFFPAESRADGVPQSVLDVAGSEGRFEGELTRVRKDGSTYLSHIVVTRLVQADGSLRGFACVTRDITEQHRLETITRQSQKMQAIGTLAGGIAHDFNNILTAIAGYTELVRGELDARSGMHEDLGHVLAAAERGRELVRRIMAFSRRDEVERTSIRIEDAVREATQLLRASLPSTIEFRTHFDPNSPPAKSNPMLIHQITMNLGTNAAQAMAAEGGVLELSVEPVTVGEIAARRVAGLHAGRYVRLRVADTGHGMTPEVMSRVLEPFFTTKPVGSGTGLGLSVVHGIVQQHNGALDIHSAPGQGTTIDVYLPATMADSSDPLVRESGVLVRGMGQHILLVDDEEMIALMTRRQLESLGYRVTPFTSSVAALAAFRRAPEIFDLLVTDNTMPVLTGLALTRAVHEIRADLPVLMVSGFGEGLDVNTASASGVRRLLPKPFSLQRLSEAVSRSLE